MAVLCTTQGHLIHWLIEFHVVGYIAMPNYAKMGRSCLSYLLTVGQGHSRVDPVDFMA